MNAQRVPSPARPVAAPVGIARAIQRTPLVWYFVLAFAFTWAWWIPLALTGRVVDYGWRPSHLPGEFGPALAAAVVTLATLRQAGIRDLLARMVRWRMAPRWWLATVSPLVFFALAVPLVRLFGGNWPWLADFDKFSGTPEIGVVGVWVVLVLTTGFGEETGWRGYAIPRLQQTHGPLAASLILSVFWMLWHVPAFFFLETYRNLNVAILPGFFLGLASGSVVLTWLYNRSGGSILAVAVWHGTYDLVAGTKAVEGGIAAVVSMLVIAQAVRLVALETRARRDGRPSVLGPEAVAAAA